MLADPDIDFLGRCLLREGQPVDTGHWQSLSGVPQTKTIEMMNVKYELGLPESIERLQAATMCNLPWAEDQFQERVGGVPLNPGETYKKWPWYRGNVATHQTLVEPELDQRDWAYIAGFLDGEGTVDLSKGKPRVHIYQKDRSILDALQILTHVGRVSERIQSSQLKDDTPIAVWCVTNKQEIRWFLKHVIPYLRVKVTQAKLGLKLSLTLPPHGNDKLFGVEAEPRFSHSYMERFWSNDLFGRRYRYGDLNDVVSLLAREPYTRQAYLPVFFPEDTGAHHGERIPCTLGYHFLLREGKLHINYFIRSCDYLRHFRDDVYLAGRLCQWVLERLQESTSGGESVCEFEEVTPGMLTMFISSLHVFEGDLPKMRREYG